jgi:hypothetical protein
MTSPDAIMQAWPITFSSSRTLPGQEWRASRICARGGQRRSTGFWYCAANFCMK